MALQQSNAGQPNPLKQSKTVQNQQSIFRTGGAKTTGRRQKRRYPPLVQTDQPNDSLSWDAGEEHFGSDFEAFRFENKNKICCST